MLAFLLKASPYSALCCAHGLVYTTVEKDRAIPIEVWYRDISRF